MLNISALEVVRVLQRIAEGQAQDVSFDDGDLYFVFRGDGYEIGIFNDAGELDGVYWVKTPAGPTFRLDNFSPYADPTDLLSDETLDALHELHGQNTKKKPC